MGPIGLSTAAVIEADSVKTRARLYARKTAMVPALLSLVAGTLLLSRAPEPASPVRAQEASATVFTEGPPGARLVSATRTSRAIRAPVSTTSVTVAVADVSRDYLLSGAPAVAGAYAPLLILYPGLDQEPTDFLADTDIVAAATAAGVVVASPESPDRAFNDGRFGVEGPDDDAFAMAIIGQLANAGAIDPARVTVSGFSNGAGMAIALAARHPDAIAAFVSVDGEMLSGPNQITPTGPVSAYFIHGTADSVQPVEGRLFESERRPGYISEQATVAAFIAADGDATAVPIQVDIPRHRGARVGPVSLTRWASPGAAAVTYASVAAMGHTWPTSSCGPLAVLPQVAAKAATARRTAIRLAALRRQAQRLGHPRLGGKLYALQRLAARQARAVMNARAVAAGSIASRQAIVSSLLPSAGAATCDPGGGYNTQVTDLSATGLVIGVASTARRASAV